LHEVVPIVRCSSHFSCVPFRRLQADRDDKVRVSRYPRAWNIEGFCLGHTEFVSTVRVPLGVSDRCVTASGDGTVRLWDTSNGAQLSSVDVASGGIIRVAEVRGASVVVALVDGAPGAHVLALNGAECDSLRPFTQPVLCNDATVSSIAFDCDGVLWTVDETGRLRLYKLGDDGESFSEVTPEQGPLNGQ
jgi:WD40 repeat protein